MAKKTLETGEREREREGRQTWLGSKGGPALRSRVRTQSLCNVPS